VLRRILWPKRNEEAGGWRKLHNKDLLYLYSSPSIIRTMKSRRKIWVRHVARMGEKRNAYRLVRKPEKRTPLVGLRHRWVDKIKMDIREIGRDGVDWIGLAQDKDKWRALVNAVMNVRVPGSVGKLSSGFTTGGLSNSAQLHRAS
jgi:hypothetical protein